MSKPQKRVTFSDEQLKYSDQDILHLQQENTLLRQKLSEMQEFCEKTEKCFNQSKANIILIQDLSLKIENLQSLDDENRKYIIQLQLENSQLSKQKDQLSKNNYDLNLKKQILESEVERLSQLVYSQEIQLKKLSLGKNSQTTNPNYKQNTENLAKSAEKSKEMVNFKPVTRRPDKRGRKIAEIPKIRLSQQSTSSKISSRRHSYSSFEDRQKEFNRSTNLEELKRLIKQAKESHLRCKSIL
jgi:hypothetical protein